MPGTRLRGLSGWTAGCEALHCAHGAAPRSDGGFRCHHWRRRGAISRACPTCGNVDLKPMGRGTQRVEETLAAASPAPRILRIDRAAAAPRRAGAHLEGIRRGEGDILVGRSCSPKGTIPRPYAGRRAERRCRACSRPTTARRTAVSVLAQVAGRAGRHEAARRVLVQTRYPAHPLYAALVRHDYAGFAESQPRGAARRGFPPFVFEAALRAKRRSSIPAMRFLSTPPRRSPRRPKSPSTTPCRTSSRAAPATSAPAAHAIGLAARAAGFSGDLTSTL